MTQYKIIMTHENYNKFYNFLKNFRDYTDYTTDETVKFITKILLPKLIKPHTTKKQKKIIVRIGEMVHIRDIFDDLYCRRYETLMYGYNKEEWEQIKYFRTYIAKKLGNDEFKLDFSYEDFYAEDYNCFNIPRELPEDVNDRNITQFVAEWVYYSYPDLQNVFNLSQLRDKEEEDKRIIHDKKSYRDYALRKYQIYMTKIINGLIHPW